jgi:hypothetical protein
MQAKAVQPAETATAEKATTEKAAPAAVSSSKKRLANQRDEGKVVSSTIH